MISLNKKKAYIGTYQEEKDAALSFDFYAILIHGLNAKTNFTYNKSQILSMIFWFRKSGNTFVPKSIDFEPKL